jgi:PleD family two-component response regulator
VGIHLRLSDVDPRRPRILIAAPRDVIRELGAVLSDRAEVLGAATFDESVARISDEQPDLLVICYVFDELRPYRLIQHVMAESENPVPMILARALPVRMGNEEADVRDSYLAMGVSRFLNLWKETEQASRQAALQHFRDCVFDLLPRAYQQSAG